MTDSTEFKPERSALIAAVVAIAATYFYFLIFAEFAFIELLRPVAGSSTRLRFFMLLLGLGGVAGSLLAAWRFRLDRFQRTLATAFRACAAAAAFVLLARGGFMLMLAALSVGLALGWLTVTLCAGLRSMVGTGQLGVVTGLGTGLAYAACNLPWIFDATPYAQTVIAALVAGAAALSGTWLQPQEPSVSQLPEYRPAGLMAWIAILLALVWMDSAAFYIIQHTPALRSGTWGSTGSLLSNAVAHLSAAVLAGLALDRRWSGRVTLAGFVLLALACVLLDTTRRGFLRAETLYTAGVSLYSVVLLYVPARGGRVWTTALVFAIAGWVGSALGIGMAQDLQRVPFAFLLAAGVVVVGGLLWRQRLNRLVLAAVALAALAGIGGSDAQAQAADAVIARGRDVYVSEGCIHCHSQYIRPGTLDEVRWGQAVPLATAMQASPPLFGNRRQGPDLSQVGARRSPEWNRLHLIAPRTISPGSRMPSYAHLFAATEGGGETRGDALVAYLASLGAETMVTRYTQAQAWSPAGPAIAPDQAAGRFEQRCVSCHGVDGQGDGPVARQLAVAPPDFSRDPWRYVPPGADPALTVARIIRFGIPGSVMAGHDELSDAEVAGLARYVLALHDRRVGLALE
ncbi:MAG TPA: cbb3-type cytochrome c oxidase subunit II [Opitutaceae bacterium]